MNEADTRFRGIAVDILTNFETVKSFAAEHRETGRFNEAMRNYNKRYVEAILRPTLSRKHLLDLSFI